MARPVSGRTILFGGVCSMIALTAASAVAQVQELPPPPAAPPAMAPADQAAGAPMPPPPPAPMPPPPPMASAPQPEIDRGPSDFDPNLRRWAIGYAGISQVPVTTGVNLTIPAVGIRYWASPTVGIDVAIGIGYAGGSNEAAGSSMDKQSISGFVVQGGVPIALSTHRHVSFQVMPLLSIARGSTSLPSQTIGAASTDLSGLRLDVGLRAGFELFFGFIGIPELALSATIGVQFEYLKNSSSSMYGDVSDTTYGFTTTVQNNPWDIFAGGIAARYYF